MTEMILEYVKWSYIIVLGMVVFHIFDLLNYAADRFAHWVDGEFWSGYSFRDTEEWAQICFWILILAPAAGPLFVAVYCLFVVTQVFKLVIPAYKVAVNLIENHTWLR